MDGARCQSGKVNVTQAITPTASSALPDEWREVDDNADYGVLQARQLLIELVGGEPGAQLRDQFA